MIHSSGRRHGITASRRHGEASAAPTLTITSVRSRVGFWSFKASAACTPGSWYSEQKTGDLHNSLQSLWNGEATQVSRRCGRASMPKKPKVSPSVSVRSGSVGLYVPEEVHLCRCTEHRGSCDDTGDHRVSLNCSDRTTGRGPSGMSERPESPKGSRKGPESNAVRHVTFSKATTECVSSSQRDRQLIGYQRLLLKDYSV
ncbi:hypothetical protein EYF80_031839 [Liparis tanakae]|uniref:Uncharacterized protein n=1 Tax=Liparis tanakae TaxID=230148 RepID=A0A4Z2GYS1_9TELE|nr:hypothetical protein EYF80_031839 [Liparis tanakae]